MNRDLFTKIGMYIVVGTFMFCVGVLAGVKLQLLTPESTDSNKQNTAGREYIHDDF